ncbi:MAG TPA: prepilin-type N-terminal cleavage/methylation domain-containing protein [Sumerlaeia bacterium]|nr:prepilin-type N-terminal cleavage/methylation domain-containing protein [Sumerlaeia bacterium]
MSGARCHGFTLIELLIVVAIIAILAAIAVPNFLEAQTRSKISRVRGDLRSLAAAIESYAVDNQRPPIDCNVGSTMGLWESTRRDAAWNLLTTPIAYITSVPQDPFLANTATDSAAGVLLFEEAFNFHCSLDYKDDPGEYGNVYRQGYIWFMFSVGPSKIKSSPWLAQMVYYKDPSNIYDATNGTRSKGYIYRSNKGEFTAAEL